MVPRASFPITVLWQVLEQPQQAVVVVLLSTRRSLLRDEALKALLWLKASEEPT